MTDKPIRESAHFEELKWLYMELYRDEHAFEFLVNVLEERLQERLDERKAAGKKSGKKKGKNISLGMMMYTENFGGNLKGVAKKLSYLEECGIDYLHLMPLLETPEGKSDGGYAVSDFRRVQPELGTMEDLEDLAAACRKKGIALCLDYVLNHTSDEHVWAKAAKAGEPEAQARYYMYDNWDIPNKYDETTPEVFPETAPGNFTWVPECGKVVMTSFHPYQWDLNYHNPTVFNDMTDNLLYLANRGVDIIRLDAIPYIWKQLGTNSRNLPQVHTIVRMMKLACLMVCPEVKLLGEVVMEPKEVVPYFGRAGKTECDMLYNVTMMCTLWHTIATKDTRLLRHQMEQVYALPKEYIFQNYLRCHDDIGWGLDYGFLGGFGVDEVAHKKFLSDWFTGNFYGSKARGELYNVSHSMGDARLCGTTASLCGIEASAYEGDEEGVRLGTSCDIMLHAWVLTQRGIPVIYSGDEVGQLNDYSYHEDPMKLHDSRYIHRGAFDWNLAEERNIPGTVASEIFNALKELREMRSNSAVFSDDAEMYVIYPDGKDYMWDDSVIAIKRVFKKETAIGLFNFSPWPKDIVLGGEEHHLEPYGYEWR